MPATIIRPYVISDLMNAFRDRDANAVLFPFPNVEARLIDNNLQLTVLDGTLFLPKGLGDGKRISIVVKNGAIVVGNRKSSPVMLKNVTLEATTDIIYCVNTTLYGCKLRARAAIGTGESVHSTTIETTFTESRYALELFSKICTPNEPDKISNFILAGSILFYFGMLAPNQPTLNREELDFVRTAESSGESAAPHANSGNTFNATGLAWIGNATTLIIDSKEGVPPPPSTRFQKTKKLQQANVRAGVGCVYRYSANLVLKAGSKYDVRQKQLIDLESEGDAELSVFTGNFFSLTDPTFRNITGTTSGLDEKKQALSENRKAIEDVYHERRRAHFFTPVNESSASSSPTPEGEPSLGLS